MLFLTMASILHVFNITPTKLGEDGKSKVPELHMSPTMVRLVLIPSLVC